MSHRIVFREEAEEELAEAKAWYETRREGLGDEFLGCVEAAVELIAHSPQMYAKVHREVRRALVRRFPYGVFYVYEDPLVTVIAIFHAKRDPRVWQGRQQAVRAGIWISGGPRTRSGLSSGQASGDGVAPAGGRGGVP